MLNKEITIFAVFMAVTFGVSYSGDFAIVKGSPIDKKSIFTPQQFGDISLYHNDESGFVVKCDDRFGLAQSSIIKPYCMDKELRGISNHTLSKLIASGSYLSVNKYDNDDYSLKLQGRVRGGGVGGVAAGAVAGKFLLHPARQA